jgi:hypothetical protein
LLLEAQQFLLVSGITLRKGRRHVDAALSRILEDADLNLSRALRMLLAQLKLELDQMAMWINEADAVLNAAVALANKLARIAWAVLAKNEPYRPAVLASVVAA